jgi:tripartite ATP-independent transporter DctM subunit
VGRLKGGLGLATVGGCTIFGALTGSSIATAVVFAKVSVPEMRRYGYDAKIAYGLVSSAGAIGMMIPPSILAVIYALITEQSVGQLLMGGIGPGLTLALCLGGGFIILLALRPSLGPSTQRASVTWRERFAALPKLWPAFMIALIVIGGIYLGVFTVTEAAGIGTFTLFVLYLATKGFSRQSWQVLSACLRETISLSVMILFLVASARVFGRLLVLSGLAPMVTDFIINMNLPGVQFIIVATVLYIVLGTFLDSVSILAITIPLLYPAVVAMGLDIIWFAMVMILATQIGNITPPVGLIIYAVKGVADPDISLEDIFRGVLPFFLMMLVAQAIVIAFPIISTWIPYHIWE